MKIYFEVVPLIYPDKGHQIDNIGIFYLGFGVIY